MMSIFKMILVAVWATAPVQVAQATYESITTDACEYNTYMCCWTENDGEGMVDNTDVCSVVNRRGQYVEYPGDTEGDVHCHGMVWAEGARLDSFILPLYKFVRTFDHKDDRGYDGSITGARQCDCIESMPTVSRADCTTYSSQGLVECEDNDLRTHYDNEMGQPGGELTDNLVGTCDP